MEEPKVGLRERTRNAVGAELAQAALKLFVEQGFEATTVEQIAAATGLSRRSFHRYFASKEDVFGQWFVETGRQLATALGSRPTEERPWLALRRAFDDLVQGLSDRPQSLQITRMVLNTPALHATHLHKHALWRDALADVLQRRLSEDGRELGRIAAVALVGAALAALDSAQSAWVSEDNQQPLGALLDEAMNAIAPLTEPAPVTRPHRSLPTRGHETAASSRRRSRRQSFSRTPGGCAHPPPTPPGDLHPRSPGPLCSTPGRAAVGAAMMLAAYDSRVCGSTTGRWTNTPSAPRQASSSCSREARSTMSVLARSPAPYAGDSGGRRPLRGERGDDGTSLGAGGAMHCISHDAINNRCIGYFNCTNGPRDCGLRVITGRNRNSVLWKHAANRRTLMDLIEPTALLRNRGANFKHADTATAGRVARSTGSPA
ncbi:TetR/AcrR family transcriptional regulator [Glycomyces luteolus]|uniref:TetR/AcrR family transcriptional regulator n=1 Tax=Glycomyces luteolus TaxID=2670330 RepID=A0A9X3PH05_9ACTN|nr:TetR/AcrR family transcriptional regulator [Glycomyces luteolus]MDA1358280.1 TetR/AcrR family transcriptional regulator [Glycomyces luteolus]